MEKMTHLRSFRIVRNKTIILSFTSPFSRTITIDKNATILSIERIGGNHLKTHVRVCLINTINSCSSPRTTIGNLSKVLIYNESAHYCHSIYAISPSHISNRVNSTLDISRDLSSPPNPSFASYRNHYSTLSQGSKTTLSENGLP